MQGRGVSASLTSEMDLEMESIEPATPPASEERSSEAASASSVPKSTVTAHHAIDREYALEHAFIKVPFEGLHRSTRATQKLLERDISHVLGAVSEMGKKPPLSKEEACKSVDSLVTRLQSLKRKVAESSKAEEAQLYKCRSRLTHLGEIVGKHRDAVLVRNWQSTRVDRVIVDYLLREGFYDAALAFAQEAGVSELVEIEVFAASRKVIDALRQHKCAAALAWCQENRLKLKKAKSNLEFHLRLQEYLQLVKQLKSVEAIVYARKYLAPFAATNMKELQQAMCALAFVKNTSKGILYTQYENLFSDERWEQLIADFKHDHYALNSLTIDPLLTLALQVGLSALKTPQCAVPETHNSNCPICNEPFERLAVSVPFAHYAHSCLVCRLSGELMDGDNYPMVLPNGMVYSRNALNEMAKRNGGSVTCPQTNATFKLDECRRAFIA